MSEEMKELQTNEVTETMADYEDHFDDANPWNRVQDFAVPLTEPILVDEERKNLLETIVEQINIVLYTIIPGLQVTIKKLWETIIG